MFNSVAVGETPATDAKILPGRVIEVALSEMSNQQSKYYMKLFFKVTDVSGKSVNTEFAGYEALREHVSRFLRKLSEKIEATETFTTTDGWGLQFTISAVATRSTESEVERKVRKAIVETARASITAKGLEAVVKSVVAGELQKELKKSANKVYPLKFLEVAKIEIISRPQ